MNIKKDYEIVLIVVFLVSTTTFLSSVKLFSTIPDWGFDTGPSLCKTDDYHDCNYYSMWGGEPYVTLYAKQATPSVLAYSRTSHPSNCINLKGDEDGVCELESYDSYVDFKWYFPISSSNYEAKSIKARVICTGFSRYLSLYAYNAKSRNWDFISHLTDYCDNTYTLSSDYFGKSSKSVKLRVVGEGRLYEVYVPEVKFIDYDEHPWSYEKSQVYYDKNTDKIYVTLTTPSLHIYDPSTYAGQHGYGSAQLYLCYGIKNQNENVSDCILIGNVRQEDFSCAVGNNGYPTTSMTWYACKFKEDYDRPKEFTGIATLCVSPYIEQVDYPYCAEPFVINMSNAPKPEPPNPLDALVGFWNKFISQLTSFLRSLFNV